MTDCLPRKNGSVDSCDVEKPLYHKDEKLSWSFRTEQLNRKQYIALLTKNKLPSKLLVKVFRCTSPTVDWTLEC